MSWCVECGQRKTLSYNQSREAIRLNPENCPNCGRPRPASKPGMEASDNQKPDRHWPWPWWWPELILFVGFPVGFLGLVALGAALGWWY